MNYVAFAAVTCYADAAAAAAADFPSILLLMFIFAAFLRRCFLSPLRFSDFYSMPPFSPLMLLIPPFFLSFRCLHAFFMLFHTFRFIFDDRCHADDCFRLPLIAAFLFACFAPC